jgi:hypothetical protein
VVLVGSCRFTPIPFLVYTASRQSRISIFNHLELKVSAITLKQHEIGRFDSNNLQISLSIDKIRSLSSTVLTSVMTKAAEVRTVPNSPRLGSSRCRTHVIAT